MAFDSTNLVSVGGATLKSNYDQLLDNTNFVHDNVLQLSGDTGVRLGVAANMEVQDIDVYGVYQQLSGTMAIGISALFLLNNGVIGRSAAGVVNLIPNSGGITSGQTGLSVVDGDNTVLYTPSTSKGFAIREWSGATYDLAFNFSGNRLIQYNDGGSTMFLDSNPDADSFKIADQTANSFLDYKPTAGTFRMYKEFTTTSVLMVNFDTPNEQYRFYGENIAGVGSGAQPYVELSVEANESPRIKLLHPNIVTYLEEFWTIQLEIDGTLNIAQSGGLPASNEMKISSNLNITGDLTVSKTTGPLSIGRTSLVNTQAGINGTYAVSSYDGYVFYNPNSARLVYSDGTNWYNLDRTLVP